MEPTSSGLPWPAGITSSISRQIRAHRKRLGITTYELAERVTAFGVPFSRDQITNIERSNQRRTTFTVGELLAFAAVLGVSPMALLIPTDEPIEIAPGRHLDPWNAYRWFVGETNFEGDVTGSEFTEILSAWRRLADAERRKRETGDAVFDELAEAIRREIAARGWSDASPAAV